MDPVALQDFITTSDNVLIPSNSTSYSIPKEPVIVVPMYGYPFGLTLTAKFHFTSLY